MSSQLNVDTIANKAGSGPVEFTKQEGMKLRHASSTDGASLFGSFNVSSLGDTATGKETINLTNSMSDNSYSVTHGNGNDHNGGIRILLTDTLTASSYQVHAYNTSSALSDGPTCSTAFGDLA
jgi:hypothetical protein